MKNLLRLILIGIILTALGLAQTPLRAQPTITTQPASQGAFFGATVTFNVAVSGGTPPYFYQWKFCNSYFHFQFYISGFLINNYTVIQYTDEILTNLPSSSVHPYITTVAGNIYDTEQGIATYSGDNGPALGAALNVPTGVALDAKGDLFIADSGNCVIRKVTAWNGIINTVAGNYSAFMNNGAGFYGGDGKLATSSSVGLNTPTGVAVDANGNLFIADSANSVIREVANGIITTVAGNNADFTDNQFYNGDGLAISHDLYYPYGVAVDANNNLFIADQDNNIIREVKNYTGISPNLVTIAGNYADNTYPGGTFAIEAGIYQPAGVAVDANSDLFIADSGNNVIREVPDYSAPNPGISTIAGDYGLGGTYQGTSVSAGLAGFNTPAGVAVDANSDVFIADAENNVVEKLSGGTVTTVAGNTQAGFSGDGPAASVELNYPTGVAVDSAGDVFIADSGNGLIRELRNNQGPTLTLYNVNKANAGYYQVVVTDSLGKHISSSVASLGVGSRWPIFRFFRVVGDPIVTLSLLSRPNWTNVLLYATNLAAPTVWQPISTNVVGDNDNWQYTDTNASSPQRYYRLSEPAYTTYVGNSLDVSNGAPDGGTPLVILGEYYKTSPLTGSGEGTLPLGTVQDVKFYGQNYNFTLYALSYATNGPNTNEQTFQVVASESFSNSVATPGPQTLAVTNFNVYDGDILAFAGQGPYYPQKANDFRSSDAVYQDSSRPGSSIATPPGGPGTEFSVGINSDTNATYQYISDGFGNQGRTYGIGVDVSSP